MAYEPLTVELIRDNLQSLKASADALRIYSSDECVKLTHFYEGGKYLTDWRNEYVKQYEGEKEADWANRRERLRGGINPCRIIPDKITAYMANSSVEYVCDDPVSESTDALLESARWWTFWRRYIIRLASIFGTAIVGPYWSERTRSIRLRTFPCDSVYPVVNRIDSMDLDALVVERDRNDLTGSHTTYSRCLDVWTPSEAARLVQDPLSLEKQGLVSQMFKRAGQWQTVGEDTVNPMGAIPFVVFRARPSAVANNWFALSDIHEAMETQTFILDQINNLSEGLLNQTFATLVIQGNLDQKVLETGWKHGIHFSDIGEGVGDAKYISPGIDFKQLLEIIDSFQKSAYEAENIPYAMIQPGDNVESGYAFKLKTLPFKDVITERREEQGENEVEFYRLMALAESVYIGGKTYTWEQAADFMNGIDAKIDYRDDYIPEDPMERLDVIEAEDSLGLLTPIEKIQRFHPTWSEDDCWDWLQRKQEEEQRYAQITGRDYIPAEVASMASRFTSSDMELLGDDEETEASTQEVDEWNSTS